MSSVGKGNNLINFARMALKLYKENRLGLVFLDCDHIIQLLFSLNYLHEASTVLMGVLSQYS